MWMNKPEILKLQTALYKAKKYIRTLKKACNNPTNGKYFGGWGDDGRQSYFRMWSSHKMIVRTPRPLPAGQKTKRLVWIAELSWVSCSHREDMKSWESFCGRTQSLPLRFTKWGHSMRLCCVQTIFILWPSTCATFGFATSLADMWQSMKDCQETKKCDLYNLEKNCPMLKPYAAMLTDSISLQCEHGKSNKLWGRHGKRETVER